MAEMGGEGGIRLRLSRGRHVVAARAKGGAGVVKAPHARAVGHGGEPISNELGPLFGKRLQYLSYNFV